MKLQKCAYYLHCMSVYLSTYYKSWITEWIFRKFVLLKHVNIFQFWLKSDKGNRHFTWRPTGIFTHGIGWVENPQLGNSPVIHKIQRSGSGIHDMLPTLCIHFLTCLRNIRGIGSDLSPSVFPYQYDSTDTPYSLTYLGDG